MSIIKHTIDYDNSPFAIVPAFSNNNISICFCSSNQYSPYLGVTIQSIIANSNEKYNYDILILEFDIENNNKINLLSLIENKSNFSIRFVNMKRKLELLKINTWAHFSVVACFKLFLLSDAFSNYDKVLALDTDLIFQRDAAELYNLNMCDNYMAAVDDVIMKLHVANNKPTSGFSVFMPVTQYIQEYLNFGSSDRYYNTGVILLNLREMRNRNLFEKCLFKLRTKGYTYQEQDVLNEICAGHILDLDIKWNVVGTEQTADILKGLNDEYKEKYSNAIQDPYVIHFAGALKPWLDNNTPFSEIFFKYARHTPWYENIIIGISKRYSDYLSNNFINTFVTKKTLKFKIKSMANRLFPMGTRRREFVKKILPRGSWLRETLRKAFTPSSYKFNLKCYIKRMKSYYIHSVYASNLKKTIKSKWVLLDSKNGTDIAGNIFRIMLEINKPEYSFKKIMFTYRDKNKLKIVSVLKNYGLKVKLIKWQSVKYYKALARAKFYATDLYVPSEYVKREDQILISTAHGTPIKVMGRDCHTETQGHLQRTHTLADFQTFPNDYMKERLFSGFMEDQLFTGTALKSGYARNDIFFDTKRRQTVRDKLDFNGKQVYAYLPTFRGIADNFHSIDQNQFIMDMCAKLDRKMNDNQLLLVKLHNFNVGNIDLTDFKHIKGFPSNYEVYDVLNATDGLISDYSSVFFDYANTRNKIILFQYDFENYNKERGVYLNWNQLPFPVVDNIDDLYTEMSSPKQYDDCKFLKKYCTYDSNSSTEKICKTIFKNEPKCDVFESTRNDKKNILIHVGNMDLRSPTTFLLQEFLNKADLSKNNYILYFYEFDLFSVAHKLELLPPNVQYISYLSYPEYTLGARFRALFKASKRKNDAMQSVFKRECTKCFASLPIDLFIDLSGKIPHVVEISKYLKCKKVLMLNSDYSEILKNCYSYFDAFLTYSDNTSETKSKTVNLKNGYSPDIMDYNVHQIERICNQ